MQFLRNKPFVIDLVDEINKIVSNKFGFFWAIF